MLATKIQYILYTDTYSWVCKKLRHQFDSRVDAWVSLFAKSTLYECSPGEVCSALLVPRESTNAKHGNLGSFKGIYTLGDIPLLLT